MNLSTLIGRAAAFFCRLRGHAWIRQKSADLKHCKRCGVQAPVKRRVKKEVAQ